MALLKIYEPGQTPAPHQNEEPETTNLAIGIDLGTTNSLVAISQNQQPKILFDSEGNSMQPSIVAADKSGNLSAGILAENSFDEKIYSIKRLMGKGFADLQLSKNLPFKIKQSDQKLVVILNQQEFSAVEISAQIIKKLKIIAEENLQQNISKAVITVPAYFDEAARNATKQAAHLAGLEVLRLISEPTAAAVAYGLDKKAAGKFLVFDLGGGTFDVSILDLAQGVFKVIGVGGDANLGGDDFDNLIGQKIIAAHNLENLSVIDLQNIKLAAKQIKEILTNQDLINLIINLEHRQIEFAMRQQEFADLSQNLVNQTIKITKNLLAELDLESDQIDALILVGGSTRMPVIKNQLAITFGAHKILSDINPDQIVALGAAIQAEALVLKSSDNLLLDVIPLSLGIEMMGGLTEKIIERNSTIPTSATREFTTYADGQNAMKLHILQGERELAKDCRSLANFEIKNIPALKAGVARIKVAFKVDADGLLTVSASETITGQTQTIEVKPSFGLDESQVKNMLLESLKNSKTDIEQRLLAEAKIEAQRNILALKSALKEDGNLLDQDTLEATQKQILKLETALAQNEKSQINTESEKLETFAEKLAEKKMNLIISKSLIGKKIDEIT